MKLVTYSHEGRTLTGMWFEDRVLDLAAAGRRMNEAADMSSMLAVVRGGEASLAALQRMESRRDEFTDAWLQADLVQGYGDDSAELQTTNGGTPTINLVVPVRYTHAHNGIVNRGDFDQMVELVVALLMKLDRATVDGLRDFTP